MRHFYEWLGECKAQYGEERPVKISNPQSKKKD